MSYKMNNKYGEWKLVKSQFSQLILIPSVAVFKGIQNLFSFENQRNLQVIYHLASLISQTTFYHRLAPSCSRIVKYMCIYTYNKKRCTFA